jgi:hypothetical protein
VGDDFLAPPVSEVKEYDGLCSLRHGGGVRFHWAGPPGHASARACGWADWLGQALLGRLGSEWAGLGEAGASGLAGLLWWPAMLGRQLKSKQASLLRLLGPNGLFLLFPKSISN